MRRAARTADIGIDSQAVPADFVVCQDVINPLRAAERSLGVSGKAVVLYGGVAAYHDAVAAAGRFPGGGRRVRPRVTVVVGADSVVLVGIPVGGAVAVSVAHHPVVDGGGVVLDGEILPGVVDGAVFRGFLGCEIVAAAVGGPAIDASNDGLARIGCVSPHVGAVVTGVQHALDDMDARLEINDGIIQLIGAAAGRGCVISRWDHDDFGRIGKVGAPRAKGRQARGRARGAVRARRSVIGPRRVQYGLVADAHRRRRRRRRRGAGVGQARGR